MTDKDDREIMTGLYLEYKRLIYHTIIQIVHDPWTAEDLMQSSVEKLIDKVDELREKERNRLVNYIITTAKNCALNYLRSRKQESGIPFDEQRDTPDCSSDREAIEEHLIQESDVEALYKILKKLDVRNRYLLEERYIREKTVQEIADDLGIRPGSARMALTRARRTALQLMEERNGLRHK